jgi:hypothetical protein
MKDDVWYAVVGVHSGSMYVDDDNDHTLRPLGKSAIRIDRFAGSLRELLRKLHAEDDTDRVRSPASSCDASDRAFGHDLYVGHRFNRKHHAG